MTTVIHTCSARTDWTVGANCCAALFSSGPSGGALYSRDLRRRAPRIWSNHEHMDTMTRRHAIGMTIGALWLVGVSLAFAALSLVIIGTRLAAVTLIVATTIAVVLITTGVRHVLAVLRLPGGLPPRTPEGRKIARQLLGFTFCRSRDFSASPATTRWAACSSPRVC